MPTTKPCSTNWPSTSGSAPEAIVTRTERPRAVAVVLGVLLACGAAIAQAPDAPAPPAPQQHALSAPRWAELDTAERALLQPWAQDWDRLPDDLRARLQRNARRWLSLTPDARTAVVARMAAWDALPPQRRAHLRARHEALQAMPPDERAGVRAAYHAFGSLPPARQAELRRSFAALSPDARSAFLLGTDARAVADIARRSFSFVPAGQRAATLRMLRDLDPAQRQALVRVARRLDAGQRERLRSALLAAAPAQRGALIDSPPP
nr:DUF3106 domain-containing protein [Chiayiivirga flava]